MEQQTIRFFHIFPIVDKCFPFVQNPSKANHLEMLFRKKLWLIFIEIPFKNNFYGRQTGKVKKSEMVMFPNS
jgi:hypothetical protein